MRILPGAPLPSGWIGKPWACQQLAQAAFDATGAAGWGRVDLMVDEGNQPWLIEVNSVPGMTSNSLVPMAAKAIGINFEQLVWEILQQTLTDVSSG